MEEHGILEQKAAESNQSAWGLGGGGGFGAKGGGPFPAGLVH